MKDLIRTIKFAFRFKGLSTLNFVLAILSTCLDLVPPLIYKLFFDLLERSYRTGVSSETYQDFGFYSMIYVIFAISSIIIYRASNYQWVKWWNFTEKALGAETFDHVQGLSLEYFSKNQVGKIIERISKGISDAISIMESLMFQFFPQVLYFALATIILLITNTWFGMIIGIGVPLYIVITLVFNKSLIKLHDAIRSDYEEIGAVRNETIYNIKTVKSYAQEDYQSRKFVKKLDSKLQHNMEWARKSMWMYSLRGVVTMGSKFLAISLGSFFVLKGDMTLGSFVLVWGYVNRAYEPMNYIMRTYDNTIRQLRSVRRLFDTLDTRPSVEDTQNAKNIIVRNGEIDIKSLSFNYEDSNKPVLSDINLKIEPKTTVAIVGKSGSGKTTLAKLLMRFHDPTAGAIMIDGQDIKGVTQKSLRSKISYVLQDSSLFNDTVINNIRFGKPSSPTKDAKKAASVANASDFISKLAKKYSTMVGERGVKLSGGEQQRINIARAVLRNSPILILDEATSALDSESEMFIQDALESLIRERTTIIIAHRLSTVMRADKIVVMDRGKIKEVGTHDDLVNKRGIYAKLFEIQSGGYLK